MASKKIPPGFFGIHKIKPKILLSFNLSVKLNFKQTMDFIQDFQEAKERRDLNGQGIGEGITRR